MDTSIIDSSTITDESFLTKLYTSSIFESTDQETQTDAMEMLSDADINTFHALEYQLVAIYLRNVELQVKLLKQELAHAEQDAHLHSHQSRWWPQLGMVTRMNSITLVYRKVCQRFIELYVKSLSFLVGNKLAFVSLQISTRSILYICM